MMDKIKTDISQNLVKELHWMGGLIETLDVGLVVIDRRYDIQMWNAFMENHSGLEVDNVLGKNLFSLFPSIPEAWFKTKIDTVFLLKNRAFTTWEQRSKVFEFKNYRPVTSMADFMYQNITLIPLGTTEDGGVQQVGIMVYDVTDMAMTKSALESSNQELEMISRKDALTQLFNRGYWEECVENEFRRYRRTNQPTSLLMFDIDHFKKVNDNYGHTMGDEVIRTVAAITRRSIRDTDVAGRYGGEEFGVILVATPSINMPRLGADIPAERLRRAVELQEMSHGGKTINVTISVGAAELTEDIETYQDWIDRADKALYHSKNQGRNQVTLFNKSLLH